MTNPNPLLWFPSAADFSLLSMLLLSILCLAYRLILYLRIGLDNSTPFAQKTVSFIIEIISGVLTFRHLLTILNPLESESQFSCALLLRE